MEFRIKRFNGFRIPELFIGVLKEALGQVKG
jgi:hypothetical protein